MLHAMLSHQTAHSSKLRIPQHPSIATQPAEIAQTLLTHALNT